MSHNSNYRSDSALAVSRINIMIDFLIGSNSYNANSMYCRPVLNESILRSLLVCLAIFASTAFGGDGGRPNIIYILADDLGYGDVQCLNESGKILTPHIDRLAAEGMIFTDAHSNSSVCTPTRYGILTGRYCWRTRLKKSVTWGYDPHLIPASRLTVAGFLTKQGYRAACFGKWHLGMDLPSYGDNKPNAENIDWNDHIKHGPISNGFDTFYGIIASLDMPPYIWVENNRFVGATTVQKSFFGPNRIGPADPNMEPEHVLPTITEKTVQFIDAVGSSDPFFIYMALNSPHTPIAPNPPFNGKSQINAYADFVMETDHAVSQVIDAVERAGLVDNTLIIFTSDNGCSPQANYEELATFGHDPSYVYRGHKADIFEGGHRIPFIVRWPERVAAGSRSDQTICLTDLLATCADIVGKELPYDAGEDSVSIYSILAGEDDDLPVREAIVHHSIDGRFAIRQGQWKLVLCPGSGGWSAPRYKKAVEMGLPAYQLFNLETDIAETTNLIDERPEVAERLIDLMRDYIKRGRSTPGPDQQNDTYEDWPQLAPWYYLTPETKSGRSIAIRQAETAFSFQLGTDVSEAVSFALQRPTGESKRAADIAS